MWQCAGDKNLNREPWTPGSNLFSYRDQGEAGQAADVLTFLADNDAVSSRALGNWEVPPLWWFLIRDASLLFDNAQAGNGKLTLEHQGLSLGSRKQSFREAWWTQNRYTETGGGGAFLHRSGCWKQNFICVFTTRNMLSPNVSKQMRACAVTRPDGQRSPSGRGARVTQAALQGTTGAKGKKLKKSKLWFYLRKSFRAICVLQKWNWLTVEVEVFWQSWVAIWQGRGSGPAPSTGRGRLCEAPLPLRTVVPHPQHTKQIAAGERVDTEWDIWLRVSTWAFGFSPSTKWRRKKKKKTRYARELLDRSECLLCLFPVWASHSVSVYFILYYDIKNVFVKNG